MKTIESVETHLSLPKLKTLEELHQESLDWVSEIDFWDAELNFFQKLLTKKHQKSSTNDDDFINEEMEGKLIRFKQEAIDEFKDDLADHEQYLDDLIENKSGFNDDMYRENHLVYENHIRKLEGKFKTFKKELFEYVQDLV